jgi:hypothetical protein
MLCRNEIDQAVRISLAIDAPLTLELKVRTPANLKWRQGGGTVPHRQQSESRAECRSLDGTPLSKKYKLPKSLALA